jgi:AcrR family transcriptional regulator
MAEHDTLTREIILEAAEDVLRRFGPQKANVVDVARALGVSHGSVYRHFASKAELRDAVVERWLAGVSQPLNAIAAEDGPAPERLKRWLDTLIEAKHKRRAWADKELFAAYRALFDEARDVIAAHVDRLANQASAIIADGVARGEFTAADPIQAGRAVFDATSRFHNPAHAAEWSDPRINAEFQAVWQLILAGLLARRDQANL